MVVLLRLCLSAAVGVCEGVQSGAYGPLCESALKKAAALAENLFGYREDKLLVLDQDGKPTAETPARKLN